MYSNSLHTHTCSHLLPLSLSLSHALTHSLSLMHKHSPKTETCKTCDTLKVKTDAETVEARLMILWGEWELHLCKAERAHQQLKEDSALAKSNPNILVLTFDLQQSLPTPVLTTNVVFYKRQQWTYNLGVHECRSEVGHMYLWHEGMASRGSHEIRSCILKHLRCTTPSATQIRVVAETGMWTLILSLWLHIVASDEFPVTVIDQKFMTFGHSYLPNDRDFGSIESET